MNALISSASAAAARRALAQTLVHRYDRTPISSVTVDGDEVPSAGPTVAGVACRYEASGLTVRDATGQVTVSTPTLTVAYEDPLAEGDQVARIRNSVDEILLAGPLTARRRSDDDPLGLTLQKTYELQGADPQRPS